MTDDQVSGGPDPRPAQPQIIHSVVFLNLKCSTQINGELALVQQDDNRSSRRGFKRANTSVKPTSSVFATTPPLHCQASSLVDNVIGPRGLNLYLSYSAPFICK